MKHRNVVILVFAILAHFNTVIYAADFSAPLIDLPKTKTPHSDMPLMIRAIVDDDSGINSVKLHYRIKGKSKRYTVIVMEPIKMNGKIYGGQIPVSEWKNQTVEYYVEARDTANNVTQEPFPNKPVTLALIAAPSLNSQAAARQGARKSAWSFGAGMALASVTVDDPDGDTDSTFAPRVSFLVGYEPARNWRILSDINIQKFSLDYSETNIGQEVTSIHLDFLLQRNLIPLRRNAWVGAGLGVGLNSATDRATARDSFILDRFEKRNDTNFSAMLDLGYDFRRFSTYQIGLNLRATKSLKDDVEGIFGGIRLMFAP